MRDFSIEDIPKIFEIYEECFEKEGNIEHFKEVYFSSNNIVKMAVAVVDNKVVGMNSCYIRTSLFQKEKYLILDLLAVKKAYRKKGIGTKLLKYWDDYAKKEECEFVIFTSSDKKKEAHKIYFKSGYKIVSNLFYKKLKSN